MGVPKIRTIVFWGLYWGPLSLGNYQLGYRYGYLRKIFFVGFCTLLPSPSCAPARHATTFIKSTQPPPSYEYLLYQGVPIGIEGANTRLSGIWADPNWCRLFSTLRVPLRMIGPLVGNPSSTTHSILRLQNCLGYWHHAISCLLCLALVLSSFCLLVAGVGTTAFASATAALSCQILILLLLYLVHLDGSSGPVCGVRNSSQVEANAFTSRQ